MRFVFISLNFASESSDSPLLHRSFFASAGFHSTPLPTRYPYSLSLGPFFENKISKISKMSFKTVWTQKARDFFVKERRLEEYVIRQNNGAFKTVVAAVKTRLFRFAFWRRPYPSIKCDVCLKKDTKKQKEVDFSKKSTSKHTLGVRGNASRGDVYVARGELSKQVDAFPLILFKQARLNASKFPFEENV